MQTPEQVACLAMAVWQVLDDMGPTGTCVAPATKALLRVAYEPFHTDPDEDSLDMTLSEAMTILREVALMPPGGE